MWRSLIIQFERSLVTTRGSFVNNRGRKFKELPSNCHTRSLVTTSSRRNTKESLEAKPIGDVDPEYIRPYRSEYEKIINEKTLAEALRTRFFLTNSDIKKILSEQETEKSHRMATILGTLDILIAEGVTKKNLLEYPWIITLNNKSITEKIRLIKAINGLREFLDFIPFLRVQMPRLRRVVSVMNQETRSISHANRVYYIAEKLHVPASLVTKFIAKRLFVLEMPVETFKINLQLMIKYNVDPISLLKDLWAFRYTPRSVEMRLKRAQQAKKDKIMPWMVRCPEPILERSLQLSLDELKVLDDKTSVAEYIGERLGYSTEDAQAVMDKHPQVNTVRVTKIKEVLDYLLLEEKFLPFEIAQVPRIVCHSLKTTKERIDELKKYNCRPSSLVIVCRSQREYDKFLNQWRDNYDKYQNKNKNKDDLQNDLQDENKENQR